MELVSIGDFARRSRLSQRALRLYDEMGLLRPSKADARSGYRWYGTEQLGRARMIVSLRHLGVPLNRIMSIVASPPSEAARQIRAYWKQTAFEHQGRRVLARYLVDELEGRPPKRFDVRLRDVPERRMLCVRRHVAQEELVLLGRDLLVRRMAGVSRVDGPLGNPFIIYHGFVTRDSDGPVEWCRPVPDAEAARIAEEFPEFVLRSDPAHQEAFVHRDSIGSDPESWPVIESLAAWAVENNRQAAEGVRVILVPDRPREMGCDYAIPLEEDG